MPRLASITSQQLAGVGLSVDLTPRYVRLTLDSTNYNEGDTITATLRSANIDDDVTIGYTVTGVSANDLSVGSLTGTFTMTNNSATATFTLDEDELTEGIDTFVITLATLDSTGTATNSLSASATIQDTSNDPGASFWLDDNDDVVTVRSIISPVAMQLNGVFATSPTPPINIEGRTSRATTIITNISANTGTILEVDDNGNSTSFVTDEELNIRPVNVSISTVDSVNEGSVPFLASVTTTNLPNGYTLFWTLSEPSEFGTSSGSFVVNNNSSIVEIPGPTADVTTEGAETFTINIRSGSTSGPILANSDAITINDTSQAPTYALTPAAFDVDEGADLNVTVTTTGVPNGTELYWEVNPLVDTFVENSGSVTISGGTASFTITPNIDYTTETESTRLLLRDAALTGNILAQTASISINDTTQATDLSYATALIEDEGETGLWQVRNLNEGTEYWWEIVSDTNTGDGVTAGTSAADFISSQLSGSQVAFDQGDGPKVNITYNIRNDLTTEGQEDARINLRAMSSTGPIIASTLLRINDTSRNQTATLTPASTTVNEGDSLLISVSTSGFPTGTQANWTLVNLSTDDFDITPNTGVINTAFGGSTSGDITLTIQTDGILESGETFQVALLKTDGTQAGISPVITIVDQSTMFNLADPDSNIFYSAVAGNTGGLDFPGDHPTSNTNGTYYNLNGTSAMSYPCTIEAFVSSDDVNSGFFELSTGFNPYLGFKNDGVWMTDNFSSNGRLYGFKNDGTIGTGSKRYLGVIMHEQAGSNGATCDRISIIDSLGGAREHTLDNPIGTLNAVRIGEMETRSSNSTPGSGVTYKMDGLIHCLHITNREKYTINEFGFASGIPLYSLESIIADNDTIIWIPDQNYYNDLTYTEERSAPGFGRASLITGTTDPTVYMPFAFNNSNASVTYEAFVYHTSQPGPDVPYLAIRSADGTSLGEIRGNGQFYIESPSGTLSGGGIPYTWPLPNNQWNHIVFVAKRWGRGNGDVGFAFGVNGTVISVSDTDFAELRGMSTSLDRLSWRSTAFDTVHSGINVDFIRVKRIDEYDFFGIGQGGTYTVPSFGNPGNIAIYP